MNIIITTTNNATIEIAENELKSMSYSASTTDKDELLLGGTNASTFNFSLLDTTNKYAGINFNNSQVIYYDNDIKIGTFYTETIKKEADSVLMEFECIDKMTEFDKKWAGAIFPITMFDLLKNIANQMGVSLINTEITNGDISLTDNKGIVGKTCREILRYIGQVSGSYAILNEDGALELRWFDFKTTNIKTIPYSTFKKFERSAKTNNINSISILIGDEKYSAGADGGYDLIIDTDNPFMTILNIDKTKEVLTNIYNKIGNMEYITCNFNIKTDNSIKCGDTVNVIIKDGTFHKAIITSKAISNLYSMDVVSSGENVSRDYSSQVNSGGGSGGGSTGDKIAFLTDYNETGFNLVKDVTSIMNGASIYDAVKDNTVCSFSYNLNFETIESTEGYLEIKLYFNEFLLKTMYKLVYEGFLDTFSSTFNINPASFIDGTNSMTVQITPKRCKCTVLKGDSSINLMVKAGSTSGVKYPNFAFNESIAPIAITVINKNRNVTINTYTATLTNPTVVVV